MLTIQAAPQEEHLAASQIILLTIERSIEPSQSPTDTILYKIESPSRLNRMLLKAHLRRQSVEGVYATYMGMILATFRVTCAKKFKTALQKLLSSHTCQRSKNSFHSTLWCKKHLKAA
jgi:hypothetical protein